MPAKKKGGKGKGKKGADDGETAGEKKRIIDEIGNLNDIGDYPLNLEMAQKLVETENIEFYMLVERLQDINRRYENDTAMLHEKQTEENHNIEDTNIGIQKIRKDKTKKRIDNKELKEKWIVDKSKAITEFDDQRTEFSEKHKALKAEYEPKLNAKAEEIAKLDMESKDLRSFLDNEKAVQLDLDAIQDLVDNQRDAHQALIAGIEKERIQQIDSLRKDMLMQIRTVRMKNSVTNEDQLQGTTKLTVIQNMQLTAELDYQSKRTEDLMFKNHEMKSVITNLTKDLEDHKEVEKELAKRSHFCQKVIQKYKQQIEDLKKEISDTDNQFKQESKRQAADTEQQDLMNYLNTRISQIEQKLQTTGSHLSLQEEEYQSLLEKMINIRNRYSKVILLLTEFIESFVEKDPALLQKQNDIFLDIDAVKEAEDLRDVDEETLVALGLVLLKQLQPYVQDLSDVKHQENFQRQGHNLGADNVIHEVEHALNSSTALQEMESRPVHLRMKEDENKLSFNNNGAPSRKSNAKYGADQQYNSSNTFEEYDDGRRNLPTQGNTVGMISPDAQHYEKMSYIRSSQQSNIPPRSDALNSGMNQYYQSTGQNSGLSRRGVDAGYTTHQAQKMAGAYKSPGVSRLPHQMDQPQLKQNFMHLRTGQNRAVKAQSRGAYNSQVRESRVSMNSGSIPYLNKRGISHVPTGSQEVQKRPRGYDQVRIGNANTGLPGIM